MKKAKPMQTLFIAVALATVTLVIGCGRSPKEVCTDNIGATRDKFHQCTPDAGGFGAFIELAFATAEAQCGTIDKGCSKPDGGTGVFNSANAEKCTTEIKAASCSSSSSSSSTTCSGICQ